MKCVFVFFLFYNSLDLNNQKILCLPSIYQFERKLGFWTTLQNIFIEKIWHNAYQRHTQQPKAQQTDAQKSEAQEPKAHKTHA